MPCGVMDIKLGAMHFSVPSLKMCTFFLHNDTAWLKNNGTMVVSVLDSTWSKYALISQKIFKISYFVSHTIKKNDRNVILEGNTPLVISENPR